jgi:hypothetical protein
MYVCSVRCGLSLLLVLGGATVVTALTDRDRALLEAARRGDAARVGALVRDGANVNAATASGLTPLIEAAAGGRTDAACVLIEAGADPDVRHRELGTALDAAQRNGHRGIVEMLRRRGARGSGKSVGDTVCVRRWSGSGFCGVIEDVAGTEYRLGITRLQGCQEGCLPDRDCSAGRPVGGGDRDAVRAGGEIRVKSWCLTHTAVPSER